MKISAELLLRNGACWEQVRVFQQIFGQSTVEVTPELCKKYSLKFDWDWASRRLLSDVAQKVYEGAIATAKKDYSYSSAKALEDYHDGPYGWESYKDAQDTAWASYKDATSAAFAKAAAMCD